MRPCDVVIRPATPEDAAGIRRVHLGAFPTAAEADLVQELERTGDAVVSIVAEDEGIVGHALFSRMEVLADGRPLVSEEYEILPHRIAPEPQGSTRLWKWWALAGVLIAGATVWLGRRRPRVLAALALSGWTLAGTLGALFLFIWLGTAHRFGWANHNLLVFNPLCWLLLPGAWQLLRGRVPRHWFRRMLWVVAACPLVALLVYWMSALPQRHLHWIVLLLPVHAALAWTWGRRPTERP